MNSFILQVASFVTNLQIEEVLFCKISDKDRPFLAYSGIYL